MESAGFESLLSSFLRSLEEMVDRRVEEKLNRMASPQKLNEGKEYYSLKEVSHITGITFLGLKGRQKRGTLKCVNEGNTVLVPKNELERILKLLSRQQK
ncbi:MAG: hypothetical protein HYZ14_15275 [Bacteroidetes bacterium]|nr:hypothetical protein [Bacteroidota bacterium]